MKKALIIGVIVLVVSSIVIYNKSTDNKSVLSEQNNSDTSFNDDSSDGELVFEISVESDYVSTSADDLYESADVVIVGKYVKDNKTVANDGARITTESVFNIRNVVKNNGEIAKNENKISISYYGGEVNLEEYVNVLSPEQVKKQGLDGLTAQEKKDGKVKYRTSRDELLTNKDKDTTKNYLIFLSYDSSTDTYFVLSEGYGMRQIDENDNVYNIDTGEYESVSFDVGKK